MAEATADNPIRELGRMAASDPELRRLLENLAELEGDPVCNLISGFLLATDHLLEEQNLSREQVPTERRAAFRVIEGGRNRWSEPN